MLDFLKSLFGFSAKPAEEPAPYKVEAPKAAEPAKCGCGRSKSGLCEGLHKLTDAEWAAKNAPVAEAKPAKPKAAARTAKPKAPKAPAAPKAKAPAKPKAPKAKPTTQA